MPTMSILNMEHTPHDCRHTFASRMDRAGSNKKSLQNIIGHANYSTTADIYTHTDIKELLEAIDMLK
ncbi:tyrosine-type recombinase/integrase [Tissierella praeacuta]|uniref:tyrosine-type recombinase/integrase n=1 Tax=Tissierella praeacuta TaxID=43131 RepID=UPI003341EF6B